MTDPQPSGHLSPVRSRTRTLALWWIAAIGGLALSIGAHWPEFAAPNALDALSPVDPGSAYGPPAMVMLFVDVSLGVLALALLPAALTHDPMEVEESYVGPPSALVAGLVVLAVWMVSVMAAPAGAIVLISISSRLAANWAIPAIFASLLSIIVHELTISTDTIGINWVVVAMVMGLTLALVGVGSVRGVLLRRQVRANGA